MEFTYITVPDCTKLELLRNYALSVEWPDLDQENWCLRCEQAFSGRSVKLLRSRTGEILLECGTPGCDGSPIEWAPHPWWDESHPTTLAYLANQLDSHGHGVSPLETDRLWKQPATESFDTPSDQAPSPSGVNRIPLSIWTQQHPPGSESSASRGENPLLGDGSRPNHSPDVPHDAWSARLQRLESCLLDDEHYERSWDCFLQEFVAHPRFIASSCKLPNPSLKSALQKILHHVFHQDFSQGQMLVMQLGNHDLFHGVVHSGTVGYLFFYLKRIDYGFLRPLQQGMQKAVVARFRIAQPRGV